MRNIVAIAAAAILVGCGYNTAVIRIVEYSADAPLPAITGAGAGVAVHQAGAEHAFAHVTVIYQGERAAIRVTTDPDEAR